MGGTERKSMRCHSVNQSSIHQQSAKQRKENRRDEYLRGTNVSHDRKGVYEFAPYMLFGAFFITLPILPSQLSLFNTAAEWTATSFTSLVFGVGIMGILLIVRTFFARHGAFSISKDAVIVGSICYVLTCLICMALGLDDGIISGVILQVICGASMLFPAVAWGFLFSLLSFRSALACAASALGLGSAFNFLFVTGLLDVNLLLFAVVLCSGLVFPVIEGVRGNLTVSQEMTKHEVVTETTIGHSLSITLDLCAGLFLLVFAASARCEAYGTGAMSGSFEYIESLSFLGGAFCVAILLVRQKRLEVSAVVNLYIPVVAAIFFFLSQFSVDSATFGVAFCLSHILMAFIVLMALASLAAVSGQGEISTWTLHVCLYAGTALCSFLGWRLYVLVGADAVGPALLLVASAYFVYVVLAALIRSRYLIERMAEREAFGGYNVSLSKACDRLAERYAFTAREREVLEYLAAGHGSPYIAEKLFISENTARTHMRNMYRKMGVSSKEELIQMMETA